MQGFCADEHFNLGDTWPVGSFRLTEAGPVVDKLISDFDIPCWPELTGLGSSEELVGFWVKLFEEWDHRPSSEIIEAALAHRPGIAEVLSRFKEQPLPLLKGQMIGPSTLIWALKQVEYPIIDRNKVLEFIYQSYVRQAYLLAHVSYKVIISLDEPCASMDSTVHLLWREFFSRPKLEHQFGIALHSCGVPRPEWLEFPWDVVHFDIEKLSGEMDREPEVWQTAFNDFFARGSWLAVGTVCSTTSAEDSESWNNLSQVRRLFHDDKRLLLSTTCGLDARTSASLNDKLQLMSEVSQKFQSDRG
jgi:hypothetical protein